MSILIKGMKFPKNCLLCPCCAGEGIGVGRCGGHVRDRKGLQKSSLLDCCGGSERLCNILKGEWKS